MKIIHLPTSVGGNSWGLSRGERKLGLHSDVLYFENNWLNYPADITIFKNPNVHFLFNPLSLPKIFSTILKVRNKYDVFHFNFGTSIIDLYRYGLPLLDIPFYHGKGKLVVTYNGCDARQKYKTMNRVNISACHFERCGLKTCRTPSFDKKKHKRIKKFDLYADAIFSLNPDLLYLLPKRALFLPYTIANWDELKQSRERNIPKRLKIVHLSTNRVIKGTDIILDTITQIKRERGDIFDFILVENMQYNEAIKILSQADLVIDQLYIGWYGAVAVEAMKMGIPVMTYIREEDLHFIPHLMADGCMNSIINVTSETLFDKIIDILDNPINLLEYQQESMKYVNKWHDPEYVASITKEVYSHK